jgi:hypothetical protein
MGWREEMAVMALVLAQLAPLALLQYLTADIIMISGRARFHEHYEAIICLHFPDDLDLDRSFHVRWISII